MTSNAGDKDLRDTGRNPKIPDEHRHMSNARVFDTLAESNLALVRTIRLGIYAIAAFIAATAASQAYSTISLRSGQVETRDLIVALSRHRCSDLDTRKD